MTSLRLPLIAASLVLVLSAVQPARAETVVIGIDGSYPPFASVAGDGELQGFDVDLVKAICKVKSLECELRNVPYDGIFAALDTGKIQVIAAGMNITDERKQKYGMPGPYLKGPMAFMTTEGSTVDGTLATLEGKTVGTVGASVFEKYLTATMDSKIDLKTYDSMDAAVLDLDAGRVDAVFGEVVQLQPAYVQAKPGVYKIVGQPIADPTYAGQGKGLIVKVDNAALTQTLNEGINAVVKDGTHAALTKKWFGVEIPAN